MARFTRRSGFFSAYENNAFHNYVWGVGDHKTMALRKEARDVCAVPAYIYV